MRLAPRHPPDTLQTPPSKKEVVCTILVLWIPGYTVFLALRLGWLISDIQAIAIVQHSPIVYGIRFDQSKGHIQHLDRKYKPLRSRECFINHSPSLPPCGRFNLSWQLYALSSFLHNKKKKYIVCRVHSLPLHSHSLQ